MTILRRQPCVYLAGPIFGRSDAQAKDWRARAKARLTNVLDPMRRDYRGRELENIHEIVRADMQDIAAADALLVYYDKPSVGTSMEVLLAYQAHKLVVVAAEDIGGLDNISPWLLYHADNVSGSVEIGCSNIIKLWAEREAAGGF